MEMRDLVREDTKRTFRLNQIEGEGNDPAKSGMTYGTPHDLASMYGRRSVSTPKGGGQDELPAGYAEVKDDEPISDWGQPGPEGGRPKEKSSVYGTTKAMGGRDPLGSHGMHGGFPSDNENISEVRTSKAKLEYLRNEDMLKHIVFTKNSDSTDGDLLKEENIKDLGK